jgi:hypothetical protein
MTVWGELMTPVKMKVMLDLNVYKYCICKQQAKHKHHDCNYSS